MTTLATSTTSRGPDPVRRCWRGVAALAALWLGLGCAGAGLAQGNDEEGQGCPGLVARGPAFVQRAALARGEVGLTFVGHATFLIESPGGVRIATDYNDFVRPTVVPDVATMNKAHTTHFSYNPDPRIGHVLRGWGVKGEPAHHDLTVGDVRIRNIATNIRGGESGTEYAANSIFIVETAGLCVAHLGHLHHTLEPSHLKKLGRIDVLLVPVDGGYTLDLDGMMEVLASINARLMVPMHYFGPSTLARFLDRARERYEVAFERSASITVSRATLPDKPKVLVLPGR